MSICKSCDYYDDCSLSESNEGCYRNSSKDVNKFLIDTDNFDWVSPVEIFTKEFQTRIDDNIQQLIEIELGVKIDREELIKAMNYDRNQFSEGFKKGYAKRDKEIVRCKDCKHYQSVENLGYWCDYWDFDFGYTDSMDFCSRGERKDDNE